MKKPAAIIVPIVLVVCLFVSLAAFTSGNDDMSAGAASLSDAPSDTQRQQLPRSEALAESMAESLKALNLFKGVSSRDLALDSAPTRTQALVMLIRLLGKESLLTGAQYACPFTDVPSWAQAYVGYAYENGITKGVSEFSFGSESTIDCAAYLTFVLRALGYSDGEDGDFLWDEPYELAEKAGIFPGQVQKNNFLRGDVATVSYAALGCRLADDSKTLAQSLIALGVFTGEDFEAYYDAQALENGSVSDSVSEAVEQKLRYSDLSGGLDITGMNIVFHKTVVEIGNAGYELYATYQAGAKRCASAVASAASSLGSGARVFYLVAPNSLGVVLSDESRSAVYSRADEKGGIDYSYACAGDGVLCVDAYRELRAHNDEYVYFRTDHHWTGLGAYYAYTAWCEKAGMEPSKLADYTAVDMPGHLGLFYTYTNKSSALGNSPDTVTAYYPAGDFSVKVTGKNGAVSDGKLVYDCSSSAYKYGCFIGGDYPMEVITNNDPNATGTGVLIKDSYGNPFAVFMAGHYKTLYVLDYRYYSQAPSYMTLSQLEAGSNIDDVVVLLSMTLSQADGTANYLNGFLK